MKNNFKYLFIDFDGVIVDSMPQKFEAFCTALNPYFKNSPSSKLMTDELQTIQNKMAGLSRSEVLKAMYLHLTQTPCNQEILQTLLLKFKEVDEYYQKQLTTLDGAREFLQSHQLDKNLKLFLVTGTPTEVVTTSLDILNIQSCFDEVWGSPTSKNDIIKTIIKKYSLDKNECVMIGDGNQDQLAAINNNINFIGINCKNASFDPNKACLVVQNLKDLNFLTYN